jgi:osmoprotectant transport system substrate-binding protein
MRSTTRTLALALGLLLAVTACGGDDAFEGDADATATATGDGAATTLTVGGANFTEMLILQEMYKAVLEEAGYTVDITSVDNREIYAPALIAGDIDVVPDYAATMAEFLNRMANGEDAAPIATSDAAETVAAMRPLAEAQGLTVLEPSPAIDANGFVVSQEFAAQHGGITTLSELAALELPLVLAAGEECPDRPFCEPGLEETYGLNITEVMPTGYGSAATKNAVKDGTAQLGLTGTTDGTLETFGLVLLTDDKGLQLADNLVPIVNTASAGSPEVAEALNAVSAALTTEDLAAMNSQVDGERQTPADVAQQWLTEQGLS